MIILNTILFSLFTCITIMLFIDSIKIKNGVEAFIIVLFSTTTLSAALAFGYALLKALEILP